MPGEEGGKGALRGGSLCPANFWVGVVSADIEFFAIFTLNPAFLHKSYYTFHKILFKFRLWTVEKRDILHPWFSSSSVIFIYETFLIKTLDNTDVHL